GKNLSKVPCCLRKLRYHFRVDHAPELRAVALQRLAQNGDRIRCRRDSELDVYRCRLCDEQLHIVQKGPRESGSSEFDVIVSGRRERECVITFSVRLRGAVFTSSQIRCDDLRRLNHRAGSLTLPAMRPVVWLCARTSVENGISRIPAAIAICNSLTSVAQLTARVSNDRARPRSGGLAEAYRNAGLL